MIRRGTSSVVADAPATGAVGVAVRLRCSPVATPGVAPGATAARAALGAAGS